MAAAVSRAGRDPAGKVKPVGLSRPVAAALLAESGPPDKGEKEVDR